MITTRVKNLFMVALVVSCVVLQGCSPKLPEEAAAALNKEAGRVVSDDIASIVKAKSDIDVYGWSTVEVLCVTLNHPVPGVVFSDETYGYFTLARKGNGWDVFADADLPYEWPKIGCSD